MGMSAGWLPRCRSLQWRLLVLATFGAGWGFLYGAILNLWSWPFAAPGATEAVGLYWAPGLSLGETLRRYAAFYLATSLVYDLFRAIGNAGLVLVALWGGFNLIVREHVGSPYHEAMELVPRLILGALLTNTSLAWGQLTIDLNNALCQAVGQAS
ncbi:MAG: hypothetical protein C4321_09605, partial [Chloroflexota bacterium]